MNFSFFKNITKKLYQSSDIQYWLDSKELHEIRVLAEGLRKSTLSNNKHQSKHAGQLTNSTLGNGSDYAENRPYQTGDDPRSINWRLSARSQETFVKTFYTDSQPSLNIFLDQRESMIFGTRKYLKISQALRATLLLGFNADMQSLDYKIWILNDDSLHSFTHINAFLARANKVRQRQISKVSITNALKEVLPQLTPDSLFYMISDFTGVQKKQLSALAERCSVQAIQILDPAELSLENTGTISLEDKQKTLLKLKIQSDSQSTSFVKNTQKIIKNRKTLITSLNIPYTRIMTNEDNIQSHIKSPI